MVFISTDSVYVTFCLHLPIYISRYFQLEYFIYQYVMCSHNSFETAYICISKGPRRTRCLVNINEEMWVVGSVGEMSYVKH